MLILFNHALTPIPCDVSVHMQCNAPLHVISCHMYNECYMDNTINTTYWCHGQSHHLHITSIHHFIHVNILCTHISTSTYNMSFYVQEMIRTQSSHVMSICTYKLIICQYIRTHILTSKHVTLNQAMTLSNKSYNGSEASHKQLQTRPRDRP